MVIKEMTEYINTTAQLIKHYAVKSILLAKGSWYLWSAVFVWYCRLTALTSSNMAVPGEF